jgi:hypothetical protein
MPIPHFNDVRDIPLATDEQLVAHLEALLEGAWRRQVWITLLDEQSRPLPIVIPTDVPARPYADELPGLADFLTCLALDFDHATLVVTLERPGPAEIVNADRQWLRLLREACEETGFPFRGPFLLLGRSVLEVPVGDYLGIPLVYSEDAGNDNQDSV